VKRILSRWLPTAATTQARKAVLGVAGVALAGAALTGVAYGVAAAHDPQTATTAAVAPSTVPSTPANAAGKPPAPAKPAAAKPAPAKPTPPKEKAIGYDFALQPNYYYCGPAATRIALTALGQHHQLDELAGQLGTTTNGTDSSFDIARVLNHNLGGNVYHVVEISGQSATKAQIDQLKRDAVGAIASNHPIVANTAGSAVDVSGRTHSFPGHYVTIVGYGHNGDTVKIADSADTEGSGSYWMTTANAANWMATHGYAAS
jgi:hypothetical protein